MTNDAAPPPAIPRVLIVDDDADIRDGLAEVFTRALDGSQLLDVAWRDRLAP